MTEALMDMVTRLQETVGSMEKRIFALEKDAIMNGKGGEALEAESPEITDRVMDKLEDRKCDDRCLEFWRQHPQVYNVLRV